MGLRELDGNLTRIADVDHAHVWGACETYRPRSERIYHALRIRDAAEPPTCVLPCAFNFFMTMVSVVLLWHVVSISLSPWLVSACHVTLVSENLGSKGEHSVHKELGVADGRPVIGVHDTSRLGREDHTSWLVRTGETCCSERSAFRWVTFYFRSIRHPLRGANQSSFTRSCPKKGLIGYQ